MPSDNCRPSVPRKVVDSGEHFLNQHDKYTGFSLANYVNGNVAFASEYGLHELLGLTPKDLSDYSRMRGLREFPSEGRKLVYRDSKHGTCFEDDESIVWVSSLDPKKGSAYKVTFTDLALFDDPPEQKLASVGNYVAECDCMINANVRLCRAPVWQRQQQGDTRMGASIPNPYVETLMCNHATIGYMYDVIMQGAEDFGLYGLSSGNVDAIRTVVDAVLKSREAKRKKDWMTSRNVPNVMINAMFEDTQTKLFRPMKKYAQVQRIISKKHQAA